MGAPCILVLSISVKIYLNFCVEILFFGMHKLGIPTRYIKCIMALYTDVKGSARSPTGFSPTFPILQSTREGCILSPLLFLIFFVDAMRALERANVHDAIMLGSPILSAILFADDVMLLC